MTDKIRWGIISTARIGVNSVIPSIKASRNGIVLGIASRNLDKARAVAKELGIERAYGSYEDLLADPDIDAIYNPLPNDGHLIWSLAAIKARKPVLCEKPITYTTQEAQQLVDAFRAENILLAEAFMYRYHPQYDVLRRLLAQNILGTLRLINVSFTYSMPFTNTEDVRLNPELGGGGLLDVGCYCVNFIRMIAEREPEAVSAFANVGPTGVDDMLVGTLQFPGDLLAHLECGMRAQVHDQAVISGTDGIITLSSAFRYRTDATTIYIETASGRSETISVPLNDGKDVYQLMVEDFADAIQQGRPITYDPADSIKNMQVLDALAESAREKRIVVMSH